MELIYFISGIITVGVVYGVVLLRKVKSSHADILTRYQSQSNISSIRYAELEDEIKSAGRLIAEVEIQMEKDQYKNLSELNTKLSGLDKAIGGVAKELKVSKLSYENRFVDLFNQIGQIKYNLNKIKDPNEISRY